jgi:hypothetical protein
MFEVLTQRTSSVQQGLDPPYSKSPSEIDSLDSSPGVISDQTHIVPFLGAFKDQQQKTFNANSNSQNYQQKNAVSVGIETDV